MKDEECSTGIESLDSLLGGLRIGDNLVWETDAGAYVDLFVEKFAYHSLAAGHNLIYVSFNRSPMTIARKLSGLPNQKNITLLDCFTSGKGDNDVTFARFYETKRAPGSINVIRIDEPGDPSKFREILNGIEEEKSAGTRYIFDSVTGMQDLWDDEAKTYRFFTYSCPRLYDLDTIAYWILEKDVHTPSFRANLEHITQVALEVSRKNGQLLLKVNKAESRYSPDMFRPQKFEIWDNDIVFREVTEKGVLNLGGRIKSLRLKGLTQTELARKINVTASSISQLERNLISPSIDSLILLSRELHIDPGNFLSPKRPDSDRLICRKNQGQPLALTGTKSDSAGFQLLVNSTEDRRIQPMLATIEPGSEFSEHFFTHKCDEFIWILSGELELAVDGENYILREGDSIYLDSNVPTSWRNSSDIQVQAIWVLSPPST